MREDLPIEKDWMPFEFLAFSVLCKNFAVRVYGETKLGEYRKRIEAFRDALKEGIGNQDAKIPYFLHKDEYQLALHAAKILKSDSGVLTDADFYKTLKVKIKYPVGSMAIEKPFPCPPDKIDNLRDLIHCDAKPSDIALNLVGWRFGQSASTVKAAKDDLRVKKLKKTKLQWSLLATCFWENCKSGNFHHLAKILDVLIADGYSLFKIYYLIQAANFISKHDICIGSWDYNMVNKLVDSVNKGSSSRPFSDLLKK